MDCHIFLQGIIPTQGSNPSLPHCRQILYHLSHQGNLRILEWEAYPFSRGFSWPRNQTGVSCIAGGFFTVWVNREACDYWSEQSIPPPGDFPDPGIKPGSPALQADSLPTEPPGKPKNIGVGGLSLLQGIFLTQESNQDLLHCWQILYQLSYQGSPNPLNSQTPGFPNKVAIPCLSTSSPNYWPVVWADGSWIQ